MRTLTRTAVAGIALYLLALVFPAWAAKTRAPAPQQRSDVKVDTVVRGLAYPWAFQFLPDGRILITERGGRMRVSEGDGGRPLRLSGVPVVAAGGQGGLLDVALAPDFATSKRIFFTYSEPRGGGRNGTAVSSARLELGASSANLADVKVIFRQRPAVASSAHFGSRIAIAGDGTLFVALGDRYSEREDAQNPANHIGKIVHITQDGRAAQGNPRRPGWSADVWSIGHRNPQAAAIHPDTGELWTVEHGARGGDELNRPQAGRNYGWPVITYGRDYSGAKIGIGTQKAGMEQPVYYWDPSIAPSGMAFYTGNLFPDWKGNLFVGALAGSHLARLEIRDGQVISEERLLSDLGERIRDVRQGPDGALYVATDSARGRILRLSPAKGPR